MRLKTSFSLNVSLCLYYSGALSCQDSSMRSSIPPTSPCTQVTLPLLQTPPISKLTSTDYPSYCRHTIIVWVAWWRDSLNCSFWCYSPRCLRGFSVNCLWNRPCLRELPRRKEVAFSGSLRLMTVTPSAGGCFQSLVFVQGLVKCVPLGLKWLDVLATLHFKVVFRALKLYAQRLLIASCRVRYKIDEFSGCNLLSTLFGASALRWSKIENVLRAVVT